MLQGQNIDAKFRDAGREHSRFAAARSALSGVTADSSLDYQRKGLVAGSRFVRDNKMAFCTPGDQPEPAASPWFGAASNL